MNKNKELIKNTAIIFIGKFCTQFVSFLLVPIYTNFLAANDYGYVDLVQTYLTLLIPIIILRFDSGVFRFLIDERKNESGKKAILSNTLIFLISQVLIFAIIFIFVSNLLDIKYAIAILINVIFMSITSVLLQATRGIGDNIGYSVASIIAGVTTIVFNIIFLIIMKLDGSSILMASGVANIICSIFLIFRNKIYKYVNLKYLNKEQFRNMVNYSLPMIPDGLSWWIVNVSDRTIITFIINSAANGVYAVSSKFSNILSSLFQIFNMSWQESASLNINDEDKGEFFTGTLNNVYSVFFSLCILILAFMPVVFMIMIGEEFKSAYLYIPPLLISNLYSALANVIGGVYIAEKNTKSVARTTILAALINIIINIAMIKRFGLFAASISTLISYIVLTIYRYIDVQKYLCMKFNKKMVLITTTIYIFSTVIYYNNSIFTIAINIVIAILTSVVLNYKLINKVLVKINFKGVRK